AAPTPVNSSETVFVMLAASGGSPIASSGGDETTDARPTTVLRTPAGTPAATSASPSVTVTHPTQAHGPWPAAAAAPRHGPPAPLRRPRLLPLHGRTRAPSRCPSCAPPAPAAPAASRPHPLLPAGIGFNCERLRHPATRTIRY